MRQAPNRQSLPGEKEAFTNSQYTRSQTFYISRELSAFDDLLTLTPESLILSS